MTHHLSIAMPLPVQCRSAGVFRPRNYARYPSRLLDHYELIFVRQGVLYLSVQGRDYEIVPNQALLLRPGMRHRGTRPNPMQLVYYWVYFTIAESTDGPSDLELSVPEMATVPRPDHMVALLNRVLEDRDLGAYGGRTADLALLLALSEIALDPPVEGRRESTAALANRADALIRSQFHTEISTATLADHLGCSANYLGRAYRKAYGISVIEALHRRRVQHAQHLLMMGELDLENIARECGFGESGYLRRIFKRHTGMTPRHYQSVHIRTQWDKNQDL